MKKLFQKFWQPVEAILDRTGMYRVVSLALGCLALLSVVYGFVGMLPYSGFEQLLSLAVALVSALFVTYLGSKIMRITVNYESAIITALIVFFLVLPARLSDPAELWLVGAVSATAALSKFVLVWRGQHLLNPAAAGSVIVAIGLVFFPTGLSYESSWWIGTPVLFLPLITVGALLVTKIRKWPVVLSFLVFGFGVYLFEEWRYGGSLEEGAPLFWLSGPSLFLAFFMLTEPFTMPPTRKLQMVYGAVVGIFAQTTIFSGFVTVTPELALVAGNILFYPFTLRRKLLLPLLQVREIASRTFEFVFQKPAHLTFKPGQYLEWMHPHSGPDSRGIRRYFTIASSPTEKDLRLALRVPENTSSYKLSLTNMKPGDMLTSSQLAGDFLLPNNSEEKLGFIAGGIGITPFRSHLQYMADTNVKHNTVLFYCNNTKNEIAYRDEFTAIARSVPLTVVHVIAKEKVSGAEFEEGYLTKEILQTRTPDFRERAWYISGPPGMVNIYTTLLKDMGVPTRRIVKDFFPGLA